MSWWLGISSNENSYSVAGNTSSVTVTLTVYWNSYSWAADNPGWSMSIDGTNYSGTANFNSSGSIASGSQTVASITQTIAHNSDGTKSIGYSGGYAGTGSGWQSTSGSRTLTTIPRVSDIAVSSSSVTAGGSQTVTTTKKSSSFTDTITVSLGTYTQTVTSGTAFTIPETWMNAFPSASSGTATATVETFNGSTSIGTKSVTFTVEASSYTLTASRTLSPTSTPSTFGSRYVQTLSKVGISVTASGYQGSTISSIITTVEGVNYSGATATSEYLATYGTVAVSTVITDSRGKTRTLTDNITVIAYHAPQISASVIGESANSRNTLTLSGAISSVNSLNAKTYTITWTNSDGGSGTLKNAETISAYDFDLTVYHTSVDTSLTYTYTIRVTDSVGYTQTIVVTGKPVISRLAGGGGVTFGAEASQSGFRVAEGWDVILEDSVNGDIDLRAISGVPIGTIVPYGGSTVPSGWLECNGAAVNRTTYSQLYAKIGTTYGSGDGSTTFNLPNLQGRVAVGVSSSDSDFDLGDTGGEKTHTLTIAEMPSHTHNFWAANNSSGYSGFSGIATSAFYNEAHQYTGGNGAHNNLQPYLATTYIIKANNNSGTEPIEPTTEQRIAAIESNISTLQTNRAYLTLLWSNSSSSSAFGAQDIYVDVDAYDFLRISFRQSTGESLLVVHDFWYITDGNWYRPSCIWNDRVFRPTYLYSDHIHFDTGYKAPSPTEYTSSGYTSNMIPYRIWGIKYGTTL